MEMFLEEHQQYDLNELWNELASLQKDINQST